MKKNKYSIYYLILSIVLIFSLYNDFSKKQTSVPAPNDDNSIVEKTDYVDYHFKSNNDLKEHYEKHGKDMGFSNKEEYEKAASDVVNNPKALYKKESEDNDDVYYLEDSNEIVFVSKEGYIRTYFYPDSGKKYFDKQ